MKYTFDIHQEGKGYWAKCRELNIYTQGDTREELRANIMDALECHIGDVKDIHVLEVMGAEYV